MFQCMLPAGVPAPAEQVIFTMSANPSFLQTSDFDPGDPIFRAHEGGKIEVAATKALRDRADVALPSTLALPRCAWRSQRTRGPGG